MEIMHAWFGEERLETCRKATRWPLTLLECSCEERKKLQKGSFLSKNRGGKRLFSTSIFLRSPHP